MARGVIARAGERDQERLAAELDRLGCRTWRAFQAGEGHVAYREQPRIDRAELDLRAVGGRGGSVQEVEIVAVLDLLEEHVRVGGEDELAGEAEQVEGLAPVPAPERPGGPVVLASQDLLGVPGAVGGIGVERDE